ncbi:DUF5319 family protein [Natronoglycomyces albus]|uniref:DUF5319 family protein n=1 Tax=Natronoglycomyces albus TaxID=2811108 RepID=A0A895XSZ5_9ACTN|nr:DUF5319 family protein [Natronoglycomyces albus]QSB04758.1 DUF5319 family protein [Natronoglycomyces albus]
MSEEPRDPFADEPGNFDDDSWRDDPDGESEMPLNDVERAELQEDMEQLRLFEQVLQPRGMRGLVVDCADCDQPHYFAWGLLLSNLKHLLDHNATRVHEPAFDPNPDEYVSWDYAKGYTDAWDHLNSEAEE